MPVIHIYGAAGSGTTTLGDALNKQYGYFHLDTDDYFWMPTDPPFTMKHPREERLKRLKKNITFSDKVVISGSLCGWGDDLIPLFDLVIRLLVPTDERIRRLNQREFERFGHRICIGGDMYENHIKFLQWAAEYDSGDMTMRSKTMHDDRMRLILCNHLTLDGTLSMQELLTLIKLEIPV